MKFSVLVRTLIFTLPLFGLLILSPVTSVRSETLNDNLRQQAVLQKKISDAQNQEKSLASQIAYENDQISLTQLQIEATQTQLSQLATSVADTTNKIADTENEITQKTAIANERIKSIYEQGSTQTGEQIFATNNLNDFLQLQVYTSAVHDQDVKLLTSLESAKENYIAEKGNLVSQQQQAQTLANQLQSQQDTLNSQKQAQNNLLASTKNSESNYQSQLAAAKAEEQALLAFANARVGSGGSILPHVSLSDGWGSYYNQRDAYWGNVYIGNSGTPVWQVGCLITSVAMVFSHYGDTNSTPGMIGANPANFWGSTPAMLIPGPTPAGHSAQYFSNPPLSYLKDQVAAGNAVILGMQWSGNEHWVVARGLDSNGNFMINDPWYDKAMNVPLSSHYSTSYIYAARVYN